MFQVLNQDYGKILKKIPQQVSVSAWKTMLYAVLLVCWGIILFGTFLLLN